MMRLLGYIFALAIIAVGLVAIGYVAFYSFEIVSAVYSGAKTLEAHVYVPLSITVLTAVLGLTATLYTQSVSRRREIESAHRDRKLEIYLQFMTMLEELMMAEKPDLGGRPIEEGKFARDLVSIRTKAVLWGSPGVLRQLSKLGKAGANDTRFLFETIEQLQREMRKDLGLSNFGLENGFFAKLPLSDPSEYDKIVKGKR